MISRSDQKSKRSVVGLKVLFVGDDSSWLQVLVTWSPMFKF